VSLVLSTLRHVWTKPPGPPIVFSDFVIRISLDIAHSSLKKPMPAFQLACFSEDVTCPIGHPCMGGGISVAQKIEDPLLARGFVLLGKVDPIVAA
jgi:hypothetical protein